MSNQQDVKQPSGFALRPPTSAQRKAAGIKKQRTVFPATRDEDRGRCLSRVEIAEYLGVSLARVHFVEQQALAKLRVLMALRGFTVSDLPSGTEHDRA